MFEGSEACELPGFLASQLPSFIASQPFGLLTMTYEP